LLQRDLLSIWI